MLVMVPAVMAVGWSPPYELLSSDPDSLAVKPQLLSADPFSSFLIAFDLVGVDETAAPQNLASHSAIISSVISLPLIFHSLRFSTADRKYSEPEPPKTPESTSFWAKGTKKRQHQTHTVRKKAKLSKANR